MKKATITIVLLLILSLVLIACTPNVDRPEGGANSGAQNESQGNKEDDEETDIDSNGNNENNEEGNDAQGEKPDNEKPNDVKPDTKPSPKVFDEIAIATSSRVNLRSGMGTNHSIVGTIKYGEGVGISKRMNERWLKVFYKGKEAYISMGYVKIVRIEKSQYDAVEKVINEGKKLMGYPYVYGSQRYHHGNGILNRNFKMGEFDCSALTQYAYYKGARIIINVTTRSQVLEGKTVRDEIRRGDLMFFTNSYRRYKKGIERVGHVAIYLGDNYILHTDSDYAVIEEISQRRWQNYLVSKRFIFS